MIDAYDTLHDKLLTGRVTLQGISIHFPRKTWKTNSPITIDSSVNEDKQRYEPYRLAPNACGTVQTALVRSQPLTKLR